MRKTWSLIVDVGRCINCHNCVLATKDEHVGNDFPGYSKGQPAGGVETLQIERVVRGEGSNVRVSYIPKTCNHCDNAPCITAAGDGSIYKRGDGIVIIDPVKARGRRDLVDSCPYQMIFWNEEHQIPQHWNFDAHLLDAGWPQPRCAQACPTAALRAVQLSDSELRELVASEKLTVLREDLQTKPRVFYRGLTEALSHRLTGNLVNVSHTGQVSNCSGVGLTLFDGQQAPLYAVSNCFGDFEFSGLGSSSSTYRLCIGRDGQPDVTKEGVRHGSIDLGTLAV